MASTWSTGGLNLRLMTTGENDNTWGDQTNDNLKRLENKITGYAAVTLSGTTHTLTFTDNPTSYADEDGRNFVLNFGGSPGGTCTVTIPARETVYLVLNNTADSNTITLTTGSGTTFNVPAGKDAFVYSDGTNVYNAMADAIFTTITGDGSALTGVLHDVVDDTTPQLGGNLDTNGNDINFGDNDKANFGASNDLQIYHDGTTSVIDEVGTGVLTIRADNYAQFRTPSDENMARFIVNGAVNLYYDNALKFETKTDGVNITGEVQADSLDIDGGGDITGTLTLHSNLDMQDGDKILLGTGDDLEIYHDGSNSVIKDTGTGNLYLAASTQLNITNSLTNISLARFIEGGAVELYHNGNKKLETTSGGIDVTGTVTADGGAFTGDVTFTDNSDIKIGSSDDMFLVHNGSNSYIVNQTGTLFIRGDDIQIESVAGENHIIGTANGSVDLYYNNSKKFETTTAGVFVTGNISTADNGKFISGTSADLQIYHDGSNSVIEDIGTGDLEIRSNGVGVLLQKGSTETLARFLTDGASELYHNNSKKLATTSSGIDVTGQVLADKAYIAEATLTDGATISWNMSTQSVAKVTLGGNRTLAAPTNGSTGQFCSLNVIQDGTGSRTLTWNAVFEFKDDTAPTLTTTASKGDLFVFRYNGSKWLEVGRNLNISQS